MIEHRMKIDDGDGTVTVGGIIIGEGRSVRKVSRDSRSGARNTVGVDSRVDPLRKRPAGVSGNFTLGVVPEIW